MTSIGICTILMRKEPGLTRDKRASSFVPTGDITLFLFTDLTHLLSMLQRLTQFILRNASLRLALLLFVAMLPFIFIFFPMRHSRLESYAGYPPSVFDTRLLYTPAQVSKAASDIGESGRQLYALTEVTLDFVFPLLYSAWLSVLLALVIPKAWPSRPGAERLILLPFLALLGDLTENICLALLMWSYPLIPPWLVAFSNLASLVKWGAGLATFGLILVASAVCVVKWMQRK